MYLQIFNSQNYVVLKFILKIFQKFDKFQPQYFYKIYILIEKIECILRVWKTLSFLKIVYRI